MIDTKKNYSIEQLQALDILLKQIPDSNMLALSQKQLKLVIEYDGIIWYGDFIQQEDAQSVFQFNMNKEHGLYKDIYSFSEIPLADSLAKLLDKYFKDNKELFTNLADLSVLFTFLTTLLEQHSHLGTSMNLHPYLFNARTIDGTCNLPFLNLKDRKIYLMSIIDINA
ncbi:hypothetical protein IIU_03844 [Bacillus cereus VD133]|uniref:Uncharacterized protein n=1 Tax=Bacillus cereus VD133 TaxID=1053233 RepID=A0A9W5PPU7_BACCE|nr:hypothetical protein [Bacillus cereus]EOO32454.1 hypothetical protein IIU_03844 [Bacillus cereus VD133]